MRKFKVMNTNFDLIARKAPNLTTIDLSYTLIEDSSLTALLKHCPSLKSLNLSSCENVTGESLCTTEQLPRLESLKLIYCIKLRRQHVIRYLGRQGGFLTKFTLGKNYNYKNDNWSIADQNDMISNLPNVERIKFTLEWEPISVNFSLLCHLKSLKLYFGKLDHQNLSLILNKCTELKTLNLTYVKLLTDEAFTTLPILAPLVELNMHASSHSLTDKTLEALGFYLSKSLVNLNINRCSRVTASGVLRLLQEAEGSLRRLEINGLIVDCDNLIRMLVRKDRLLCNAYFNLFFVLEKFDERRVFTNVVRTNDIVNDDAMKLLFFIDNCFNKRVLD
jgi:hypothetical protein